MPDGSRTGSWTDEAVFGDNLTGAAVTTISFDGVYSISNLITRGTTTRYTYGANADEFIPIQCWGSFVGSDTADTLVPTIACKLRLGIECTDKNYGSETPTIRTENPNEALVIGPWGYRTKSPSATGSPKEPGLALKGKGVLQFDGAYNTGWGSHPQTSVTMSGGKMIFNAPMTFRTLTFSKYNGSDEVTTIYIGENGSIGPASSYNYLYVYVPVRVYGPGKFYQMISYQPTRGDGYGNYPGWFFSGFSIGNTLTIESPMELQNYSGATPERLATMKMRMVMDSTGTFVKRGTSYLDGEVLACYKGWDDKDKRYYAHANGSGTFDVDSMGKSDGSVTGALGTVDFVLGNNARLRHSGPGEWTDRSLIITGLLEKTSGQMRTAATFEYKGTGTLTLASPVYCRGVDTGTLKLENATTNAVIADCTVGAGVDFCLTKGPWLIGENFTCAGNVRTSGSAELTVGRSLTVTNLFVDSGSQTVFVKPGVTLAITNFTCASGATVDFEILGTTARVVIQNRTVSGTVKVNGMAAKFNDDGSLDYDADDITDHVWKWAGDGLWTAADRWLHGVPTATSFNDIIAPGADYTVTVDGDETGAFSLTNLTVRNLMGGTATLLVTNGAEMTLVRRMKSSDSSTAPLQLGKGSRLWIADAKVILRDHGTDTGGKSDVSPLRNAGGDVEVTGTGELVCYGREGTSVGAKGNQDGYYTFGTGHYVFRDNAKLHIMNAAPKGCGWSSVVYPNFVPSAVGESVKVEFLDNAAYVQDSVLSYWKGEVRSNGGHVELVFDTSYPNEQTFWSYSYVGEEKGLAEMKFKRGQYAFGNYLVAVGSFGKDDGTTATALFTTGRVEIASGASLRVPGQQTAEKRAMTLGHALPSTLSRGQALAYGEIVSAGNYTQPRGSFCLGAGVCGEGVVHQTGGSFKAMYSADSNNNPGSVSFGVFGGRGRYTIDDGAFQTYRNVFVGGATTNDLYWSPLKNAAKLDTYHDAQGEIRVNGGTFTCSKKIVLGADGTGCLALSGTGTVTAVSIVVSNTVGQAASSLAFVSDATGRYGKIAPATRLVFADGSKLVIDAAQMPENARRQTLLALDNDIEGLDYIKQHVEVVNAPQGATADWSTDGRRLRFGCRQGSCIIVR